MIDHNRTSPAPPDSVPPEPPSVDMDFISPPPHDVPVNPQIIKHPIPFSMLDPDAVKVVRRLKKFGFQAYLVGGCIRDILLGRQPKDFDVATSARPAEIRHLFRNCRLIGRRFRLAHLHFKNRKIIEVATFRRTPTEQDDISERHAAENIFGGPADDAIRRDFTINALMYDVARQEIYDWVDGLMDIENRTIRTIGDPNRRLPEDPVRIIRAAKFSVRLNLNIEPSLMASMKQNTPLISKCSPARLIEEIFKILRSGASVPSFALIQEIGVLGQLTPNLSRSIENTEDGRDYYLALRRADQMILENRAVSDTVLLAAFLYSACAPTLYQKGDVAKALEQILKPLIHPLPFTRRHMARVRQIFIAQRRIATGPKNKRSRKILEREYAAEAIDLLEMTARTDSQKKLASIWRGALSSRHSASYEQNGNGEKKPRRRPRYRRQNGKK